MTYQPGDQRLDRLVLSVYPPDWTEGDDVRPNHLLIYRPPDSRDDLNIRETLEEAGFDSSSLFDSEWDRDFVFSQDAHWGNVGVTQLVVEHGAALLQMTVDAAVTLGIEEGLRRTARLIVKRKRGEIEERPITDAEAEVWGLQIIASYYKVDESMLTLVSVELSGDTAMVCARAVDGMRYSAEVALYGGLVGTGSKFRRELPSA